MRNSTAIESAAMPAGIAAPSQKVGRAFAKCATTGGTLYVPWGYVGGVQCDPIEKKPFFHAYPGARAFSFGMLGCDLHCGYCQNWVTSQSLRDPAAIAAPMPVEPADLVRDALRLGARAIVSTYNEPL